MSSFFIKVLISVLKLFEPKVSYSSNGDIQINLQADDRTVEAFKQEWSGGIVTPNKPTHTKKTGFMVYTVEDALDSMISMLEENKYFSNRLIYRSIKGKLDEKYNYDLKVRRIETPKKGETIENDPRYGNSTQT